MLGFSANPADALVFSDVLRQAVQARSAGRGGCRALAYRAKRNTAAHDYGEGFANFTLKLLPACLQDVRALGVALQGAFDAAA